MTIVRWAAGLCLLALCAAATAAPKITVLTNPPVAVPSAICFGAIGDDVSCVSASNPLPTTMLPAQSAATSTPLAGSSTTTQTVGPFAPQLGRPINITLAGTWTGSAQLLRSIDGGATKSPVTVGGATWASYSANANEPAWVETEAGATYYLALTLSAGTLTYRVSQ